MFFFSPFFSVFASSAASFFGAFSGASVGGGDGVGGKVKSSKGGMLGIEKRPPASGTAMGSGVATT